MQSTQRTPLFVILFNYISGTKQQEIETSPTLEPVPSSVDQGKNAALEASLNPVLTTAHGLPGSWKSKMGWNDDLIVSRSDTLLWVENSSDYY